MPFGGIEIVVIAVIVLLLFGGSRIPKIARSLGSSVSEFRKGVGENDRTEDEVPDSEKEREKQQLEASGSAGTSESENGESRGSDDSGRRNGSTGS